MLRCNEHPSTALQEDEEERRCASSRVMIPSVAVGINIAFVSASSVH